MKTADWGLAKCHSHETHSGVRQPQEGSLVSEAFPDLGTCIAFQHVLPTRRCSPALPALPQLRPVLCQGRRRGRLPVPPVRPGVRCRLPLLQGDGAHAPVPQAGGGVPQRAARVPGQDAQIQTELPPVPLPRERGGVHGGVEPMAYALFGQAVGFSEGCAQDKEPLRIRGTIRQGHTVALSHDFFLIP